MVLTTTERYTFDLVSGKVKSQYTQAYWYMAEIRYLKTWVHLPLWVGSRVVYCLPG